jgi:hypothetical protein
VQFLVHVPSFPKLVVNLFVNGKGSKVLVVLEPFPSGSGEGSSPPPPHQDKDKDKEDEEENEHTDHNDSDSHWKRRKAKAAEPSPAQGSKDKAPAKQSLAATITKKFSRKKKPGVKPDRKKGSSSVPIPKASSAPVGSPASALALAIAQYGSYLPARESFAKKLAKALSPDADALLDISSDDGPNVSPDKAHKLSAAIREEIGWESPNEWDFKNETLAQRCKKLKVGRSFEGWQRSLTWQQKLQLGSQCPRVSAQWLWPLSPHLPSLPPSSPSPARRPRSL